LIVSVTLDRSAWALRCRAWLLESHLPLWAQHGIDREAWGFFERLDAATLAPTGPDQRRSMVCARQLYLWSAAAHRFDQPEHHALADYAFATLRERFQDKQHGGWVFSLRRDGSLLDGRKDFYAHAFILFALAHYARLNRQRTDALTLAAETWGLIQDKLRLPQGWFAAEASADWEIEKRGLVQNPHMHLFEALLALLDVCGDIAYRNGAQEIVTLFRTRLYTPDPGVIGEFFDVAGQPTGPEGAILEPGHHFEWAWLLRDAARHLDDSSLLPLADHLTHWAETQGSDTVRRGTYDQISRAGVPLQTTKRIWPQSEAAKTYATAYSAAPSAATLAPLLTRLEFLFSAYLQPDGRWHEHLSADLQPMTDFLPASTPYHLYFALAEALDALAV
jgi:mannose-6-phosphate isomerase